jgi:hypothetical protein
MFACTACCAEKQSTTVLTIDPLSEKISEKTPPNDEKTRSAVTVTAYDNRDPERDPEQMQPNAPEVEADVSATKPTYKEFRVEATKGRNGGVWGVDLDLLGGKALNILSIRPGCIQEYNRAAAAGEQLQYLDYITEVNGVADDVQKLLKAIKVADRLVMRILRTTPFRVTLQQGPGENFKKALAHADRSTTLTFQEVPSLVEEWNASHPYLKIQQYDRVLEVNGVTTDCVLMLEKLEQQSLSLMILPSSRP